MASNKVIVIGAGIAGLVAAYTLKKQNINVTVLEGSSHVGGRMVSDLIGGYVIDKGAQFLLSEYKILLSLIRELGLEQDLRETGSRTAIVRSENICKVNFNQPFSLLSNGLLKWNEWLRFVWKGASLSKSTSALPLNDYSQWQHLDTKDAAQWCRLYYGKGVKSYVFDPVLEGIYFHPLEMMSKALAIAMSLLYMQHPKTLKLSGGMGSLPKALALCLEVILDAKVQELKVNDKRLVITTNKQTFEADQVILATTSTEARRLYQQADPLEQKLMQTGYSSTINISIAARRTWNGAYLKNVYGLLIPRKERGIVAAVGIESHKSDDRAPEGDLLNVMLSGEAAPEMLGLSKEEILTQVLPELERYFPALSESILFAHVSRWQEAEPLSPIGRSKNIFEYRNRDNRNKKIILAGDYMGMPFTEGAAETGVWAASQVRNVAGENSTHPALAV